MSAVVGADINLGNAKMPHTYSNRYEAFLRSFAFISRLQHLISTSSFGFSTYVHNVYNREIIDIVSDWN